MKKNSKKRRRKSLKKIMKDLFKEIKAFVLNVCKKIKSLSKEIKIIVIVWIIIFVVVLFLILFCNSNKKVVMKHEVIEDSVNSAALEYAEARNLYPTEDQKLRLNIETLIESGNLTRKDINDDSCLGYALVYYDVENEKYEVKSYLSCKKYITDGYTYKD